MRQCLSLYDFLATTAHPVSLRSVVAMVCRKSATAVGNTVFLSPAMFELFDTAGSIEERIHLVKNIPVYIIGSELVKRFELFREYIGSS